MEYKETVSKTIEVKRMLEDTTYFKYIFKKTEKIACAVFYITREDTHKSPSDSVVRDLEESARIVLNVSLESLRSTDATRHESVSELRFALLALETKLRVASAARLLSHELLTVFIHEIDSVYRTMKRYAEPSSTNPFAEGDVLPEVREERRVPVRKEVIKTLSSHTPEVVSESQGRSRRDRILDFIRDKGEATIKDITDVVTDCSEKTIQRELISLIKDNVILREGERRWSKYKLV